MRSARNEDRDKRFYKELYDTWYKKGALVADPSTLAAKIYTMMGYSDAGYLKHALSQQEIEEIYEATDAFTIQAQTEDGQYLTVSQALEIGSYLGFLNPAHSSGTGEKSAGLNYRQRRIVINLTSQQAAVRATKALGSLSADPTVFPDLTQFKVFLSATAQPTTEVKNDKIVVYYRVGDQIEGDADYVGDRIVAAVTDALREGDADETVTPFYSQVTPAISWAEEPVDYIQGLRESKDQSFTWTRAAMIASLLKGHAEPVRSAEELQRLIEAGFGDFGVMPKKPHRHLGLST
ncbi:hypothetical protein GCM10009555_056130 [Acrocarpospora macrocephala]|uniref:Uncharacterized protein n=1 Tax=Acrocarpospora macrocephala TaxID=150177 RepID=A0A5M3WMU5_9ACTN|nr:T3SS effector HopA1 family protein [Acrocarpospora macrocephala]GES08501.1 hypothetical protein Amac_020970 [Acrocarpospora macrocephala]